MVWLCQVWLCQVWWDGAERDMCMVLNWDGQVHGVAVSGVVGMGLGGTGAWS